MNMCVWCYIALLYSILACFLLHSQRSILMHTIPRIYSHFPFVLRLHNLFIAHKNSRMNWVLKLHGAHGRKKESKFNLESIEWNGNVPENWIIDNWMSLNVNKYPSNERKQSAFYVFSCVIVCSDAYTSMLRVLSSCLLRVCLCVCVCMPFASSLLLRSANVLRRRKTIRKKRCFSHVNSFNFRATWPNTRAERQRAVGVRQANNRNTINIIANIFTMRHTDTDADTFALPFARVTNTSRAAASSTRAPEFRRCVHMCAMCCGYTIRNCVVCFLIHRAILSGNCELIQIEFAYKKYS